MKNKAKGGGFGLFLSTVPGVKVPHAITIAESAGGAAPPQASVCCSAGRMEIGRDAIPFLRCSVLSSPHSPTSCMSSAVPSSPRGTDGLQAPSHRPAQPGGCCASEFSPNKIRGCKNTAWSESRHGPITDTLSDGFALSERKKHRLQLCPSVKVTKLIVCACN